MKQFIKFLKNIKSFWKIYSDYGYCGETIKFIIENYEQVLQNRTKLMSKPTHHFENVIAQLDKWYEESMKGIEYYGFEGQGICDSAEYE